jgi:hypothetical protein
MHFCMSAFGNVQWPIRVGGLNRSRGRGAPFGQRVLKEDQCWGWLTGVRSWLLID